MEEVARVETFRFPAVAEPRLERLVALSEKGVGSAFEHGRDAAGAWLRVRTTTRTLAQALDRKRDAWPALPAIALARDVAVALAAIEAASDFVGPITPAEIGLGPERTHVVLDAYLVALQRGATEVDPAGEEVTRVDLRYVPPAQASGRPWDHAANRYVLGLWLYRLLAGAHAFGGGGLRQALAEAERAPPPPMPPEIAARLPAGAQSLVLRLLDPDEEARPTIDALVASLTRLATGDVALGSSAPTLASAQEGDEAAAPEPPPVRAKARAIAARPKSPLDARRALTLALPLALGAAAFVGSLAFLQPPADDRREATRATVRDEEPLGATQTLATDCMSCHPRQTAEWRRSVMGHAVTSPLFNSLELVIQEQLGRDRDCPNGAGILRKTRPDVACNDAQTGLPVSGAGGEHWCVSCHAPLENLEVALPAWEGKAGGDPRTRLPVRDLVGPRGLEGISCGFCHQVHGPASPGDAYQGNPGWTSFKTGQRFTSRPEDQRGVFGIGNSGYDIEPASFLVGDVADPRRASNDAKRRAIVAELPEPGLVHDRTPERDRAYLKSSEFCGTCHDVRLFGTDVIGASIGESFKRLRNAYTEWDTWAKKERRAGKTAATCQDCHMSTFPGVCVPGDDDDDDDDDLCPPGSRFSARKPGIYAEALAATRSDDERPVFSHYLSGVDLPLAHEYPDDLLEERSIDALGFPISPERRRDLLLKHTFRFEIENARVRGATLSIPVEIENTGAGHRVPAGFSQEREFWVHLKVTDAAGRVVYEVGRIDRDDQDLRDKIFTRVNTDPDRVDFQGRPEGLFGADVSDGPDAPAWSPPPDLGGSRFTGKGIINFQNGFLRCVQCIGTIDAQGHCQPLPGQERARADRFVDGAYDIDTGECRSNLAGRNALFETYFPVGALDASRGIPKAPDAIIDTRSAPPGEPIVYTYELPTSGFRGPFKVEARLLFRAFPPYLIRAFAEYETRQAQKGLRPRGPLVDLGMLERLDVVELSKIVTTVER